MPLVLVLMLLVVLIWLSPLSLLISSLTQVLLLVLLQSSLLLWSQAQTAESPSGKLQGPSNKVVLLLWS
jgi:hypothetical protein